MQSGANIDEAVLQQEFKQYINKLLAAKTIDELLVLTTESYSNIRINLLNHKKNEILAKKKAKGEINPVISEEEEKNIVIPLDDILNQTGQIISHLLTKFTATQLTSCLNRLEIVISYSQGRTDNLSREELKFDRDSSDAQKLKKERYDIENLLSIPMAITNLIVDKMVEKRIVTEDEAIPVLNNVEAKYEGFKQLIAKTNEKEKLDKIRDVKISIDRFHYSFFSHAKLMLDEFLQSAASDDRLMSYINGDNENGMVRIKDGTVIPSLNHRLQEIENSNESEAEKLLQLEQAILNTYYQVRKDQGWRESSLANALEQFLTSPQKLNLLHKYGPACKIPHQVRNYDQPPSLQNIKLRQDHFKDELLEYFNGQEALQIYMKDHLYLFNNVKLDPINLEDGNDRARMRYVIYRLGKELMNSSKQQERQKGFELISLLSPEIASKDKKNYPFSIAYQKLKVQFNPSHFKDNNDRKEINNLMKELEGIRAEENLSERKKWRVMKYIILNRYNFLNAQPKGLLSFFNNKFENALKKFLHREFKMTQLEQPRTALKLRT